MNERITGPEKNNFPMVDEIQSVLQGYEVSVIDIDEGIIKLGILSVNQRGDRVGIRPQKAGQLYGWIISQVDSLNEDNFKLKFSATGGTCFELGN